jgi:hypothetical protein
MGHDDRDRSFEKALAQQLRSSAQAGVQNTACPDAETLAAYHERQLSLEELSSWKTHLMACARCQEILVHLELTDNLPVGGGEEVLAQENVLGLTVPQRANISPAAREMPRAAASLPLQAPASPSPAVAARATVATLPPPRAHWRWTAPVGAIAAGLLVWIVLHENKSVQVPPPAPVEVAVNRDEAPPAQQTQPSAKTPALTKNAEPKKEQRVRAPQATIAGNRGAVAAPSPNGGLTTRSKRLYGSSVAPAPSPSAPSAEPQSAEIARDLDDSKRKDISNLPSQGRSVGALRAGTAAPAPGPANKTAAAGGAAPPPSAAPRPAADAKQKSEATETVVVTGAAPAPVQTDSATQLQTSESVTVNGTSTEFANVVPYALNGRLAKMRGAHEIPAPGGRVIWRVGPLGIIERTDDGGRTWKPQKSGVTVDLLAGSAPSKKVCWLAGRAGTLLWTKNGGKHWVKLASPIEGDLSGVRASDDLHASVSEATGKTFETSDGGKTWTPVANQ